MANKQIFRKSCMAMAIFAAMALLSNSAMAKTYRWVLGAGHPGTGSNSVVEKYFAPTVAKRIKAATGDNVKWVFAWGGAIAKVGDELEAVGQGTLTFGPVQYPFEWAKLPLGTVFYNLPFNTSDMAVMDQIGYRMHKAVPFMEKELEKNNVKYIGNGGWDSYQVLTKFPVRTIDDLKNRKISGAGPNLQWIKAAGAIPVQGNLTEWYTSLQTGVVEGALVAVTWINTFKFWDVAKYVALADFGAMAATGWGMNLDEFNDLPKEIQDIILQTGEEMVGKVTAYNQKYLKDTIRMAKQKGVTFYQMPYSEKRRWANLMPNYPAKFIKTYEAKGLPARKLVEFVIDEQKKAGYRFPRDWKLD